MSPRPSVVVRRLWEAFAVSERRPASVKELVSRPRLGGRPTTGWALADVSFDVRSGEIVGLLGANGSGKTTLLRCVAGVLPPTRGEVLVRTRPVSLLELELGFHPELTGRENALLAGALFGAPRKELVRRLDDIARFGGLEAVLDREVRTYSSGMRVRLAFALGLELCTDLLLVDEYLAAGDDAFRRSCNARLAELGARGTSAILVAHERSLVEAVCDRCLLLDGGRLVADGAPADVLDLHLGAPAGERPDAVSA